MSPETAGRTAAAILTADPPEIADARRCTGQCAGTAPYWTSDDGRLSLYLGDCREVLPALDVQADLIVADPPYAETSLPWDRWPEGWLTTTAAVSPSMWCFGSMRMWLAKGPELSAAQWRLSQDFVGHRFPEDPLFDPEPVYDEVSAIWEKEHGTNFAPDRFRRVHEHAAHFYQDTWKSTYHDVPRVPYDGPDSRHGYQSRVGRRHTGKIADGHGWVDDGTRLMKSVIKVPSMWRRGAIHPTEKPTALLDPLIRYGCPPGGLVIDPFAGSASTLAAAHAAGRRAVGIEAHEPYIEAAAKRLEALTAQPSLFTEESA